MKRVSVPHHGIVIEKDIEIPIDDGVRLKADVYRPRRGRIGSVPYTHYSTDYNTGENTIQTGGSMPAYPLLPIIPKT